MSFTAFPPSPTVNTLGNSGELLTHDGSTDKALTVGGDGTVLTANSGAANGIEWQSPAGLPAGGAIPYGGSVAPSGYLICDGSLLDRTVYADLFAAIGTAFGSGDGSTTFAIPDLRGRFVRGRANGSGLDPDRDSRDFQSSGGNTGDAVGSVQSDTFESHTHSGGSHTHAGPSHTHNIKYRGVVGSGNMDIADTFANLTSVGNAYTSNTPNSTRPGSNFMEAASGTTGVGSGGSGSAGGSTETRPENIYFNYIIKY